MRGVGIVIAGTYGAELNVIVHLTSLTLRCPPFLGPRRVCPAFGAFGTCFEARKEGRAHQHEGNVGVIYPARCLMALRELKLRRTGTAKLR